MTSDIPGWEKQDGTYQSGQIVDSEWYVPQFGCDSLQMVVDELRYQQKLVRVLALELSSARLIESDELIAWAEAKVREEERHDK
jgi:hypothetical protein